MPENDDHESDAVTPHEVTGVPQETPVGDEVVVDHESDAGAPTEAIEPVAALSAESDSDADADPGEFAEDGDPESASGAKNPLAVAAVVTGALLLFPIAIILGHMALAANKRGEANNRTIALAGTILGYIGLAAVIVTGLVALLVVQPSVDAQNSDTNAKSDVITLGNALVAATVDDDEVPSGWDAGAAWAQLDANGAMELATQPGFTVSGDTAYDWCLILTYEGGNDTVVAYSPTAGLVNGSTCS